ASYYLRLLLAVRSSDGARSPYRLCHWLKLGTGSKWARWRSTNRPDRYTTAHARCTDVAPIRLLPAIRPARWLPRRRACRRREAEVNNRRDRLVVLPGTLVIPFVPERPLDARE